MSDTEVVGTEEAVIEEQAEAPVTEEAAAEEAAPEAPALQLPTDGTRIKKPVRPTDEELKVGGGNCCWEAVEREAQERGQGAGTCISRRRRRRRCRPG